MMGSENSKEDLIELRKWVLGVIAFATAISAFLVTVLGFDVAITSGVAALVATLLVIVVFLIDRAEKRMNNALEQYKIDAVKDFSKCKSVLLDIQRSSLRTELNNEIYRNPQNHDTILRMGEKYFVQLGGDWVETDLFQKWIDDENAAGRKVNVPPILLANLSAKLSVDKGVIE